MSFRIPRTNYEWDRPALGITETEFDEGKNLWEGIHGQPIMDTKVENTERLQVMDPHGDHTGRPMPRDGVFHEADNMNEWGKDHFDKAEYNRRFGHLKNAPYYGRGLPDTEMERANANPAYGNAAGMDCENDPRDQGKGSKPP